MLPTRVDSNIDIPNSTPGTFPIVPVPGLGTGGQQDGAIWKGLINITTAGTYTFTSSSDDASQVYVDGNRVVQNDGAHGIPGGQAVGIPIFLTAGYHAFGARFQQSAGGAAMVV